METFIAASLIGHDPVTALGWAIESAMTDLEEGALNSPMAEVTNVHGLRGIVAGTDAVQTIAQGREDIRNTICESAKSGQNGRGSHTIQDTNALGHKDQIYPGKLTWQHFLMDLSPGETYINIPATMKYLWENAPPSLPRRAFQVIFGR